MRVLTLSLTVALLANSLLLAADTKVTLSGDNTKVEFVGTKKEGKHDGGFKKLTGTATVGADPTKTKLDVTIDTTSLFSDDKKLTGHLLSADFFNAKKFPTAKFITTKIESEKKGHTVTGDLTMLGKTKSISFPADVTVKDGKLVLKATFTIKRSDWGMTYGSGKVDDEVKLTVSVDAK